MTTDPQPSGSAASGTLAGRLTEPTRWKMGWVPQLDGLRGVATVFVMIFHFLSEFENYVRGLTIGVDIFFALSGFLITTLLFAEMDKKGSISIRKFYIRRAVRLFPALYTLLAVFLLFAIVFGGDQRTHFLAEAGAVFAYIYDFFVAWVGVKDNALIQLWTLSIEQQFYLLWPVVFLLVIRPGRQGTAKPQRVRILVATMIGFALLLPLLRLTLPHELGARTASSFVFGLSIMRPDAVVLGCLAAFVMRLQPPKPVDLSSDRLSSDPVDGSSERRESVISTAGNVALAILVASIALAPFSAFAPFVSPFANLAIAACAVFVFDLVRNPHKPAARLLRSRPLVWVGERSYAMYIWHLLLLFMVQGLVSGAMPGRTRLVTIVTFPIVFAVTIGVAMASWRFIEQPAMKLKKRFNA